MASPFVHESSYVDDGAVIGAVLFGERFGRWRIAATVLVAAGVVLVTL